MEKAQFIRASAKKGNKKGESCSYSTRGKGGGEGARVSLVVSRGETRKSVASQKKRRKRDDIFFSERKKRGGKEGVGPWHTEWGGGKRIEAWSAHKGKKKEPACCSLGKEKEKGKEKKKNIMLAGPDGEGGHAAFICKERGKKGWISTISMEKKKKKEKKINAT